MGTLLPLYYTPTKRNFLALGQRRGTRLSHVVPTFPQPFETAMVSVVGVSSDGFQSTYVHNYTPSLLLSVFQIKDDSNEHNKSAFANFKRMVWHELFFVIIRSIIAHSKTGCWLECGNGVKRWLFPIVLMLSVDYEEQYVLTFS